MKGVLLLVIGVALAGCTVKTTPANDDAGAATGTIGDQCTRIYTALCQRSISTCGQTGFTLDQCVTSGRTQCCADKCAKAAITPDSKVDVCAEAVASEDCNAIVNNTIPYQCQGIPATQ